MNDAGFYQAKAVNMEGEAICSSLVNVLPTFIAPEPMIIESQGYPPEFLQLFHDQKATLGSTIKFESRITGTQPLNVNSSFKSNKISIFILFQTYWLFNGSPINRTGPNQRYQQNVFNDIYTLTIHNIRYEDIGRYTLNAENSWGKATCTAELFIPPTATISRMGKNY